MATTTKQAPRQGGKGKERAASSIPLDAAPQAQVGKPRLQKHYETVIRPALAKEFGLTNAHQVPRVTKVVLNVGLGEAHKQPKLLDAVIEELMLISGQRPVTTRAKKAIANSDTRTDSLAWRAQASAARRLSRSRFSRSSH